MSGRLAIFGGTFDPIHSAHIAVARAARDRFALDRILFIPAGIPPHKLHQQAEAWEHRFRMVELATADEREFEASDLESGEEKSYSFLTIARVLAGTSDLAVLYFVIGADAFADITTWHRWRDVIAAVEFIVVTRPGHTYAVPEGARVHVLDSVQMTVSSSEIRETLGRCERPEEIPLPVFEYIRDHKLYGFGSACQQTP